MRFPNFMPNLTLGKEPGITTLLADSRHARVTSTARIILWLFAILPFPFFAFHSLAFEGIEAHPPTARQVVKRMVEMNRRRAEALRRYTSIREYHLELKGFVHKRADLVAKMS